MKTYQFICKEHEEYGSKGWVLSNMAAFDPLGGMAVAHDILEHWPNDDSTTGELRALGAMLHVRGEEYNRRKGKMFTAPSYHFSGELGELLLKIQFGEWVPLKEHKGRHSKAKYSWANEEIEEGIILACKHIQEEYQGEYAQPAEHTLALVYHWLSNGYNSALRRYAKVHPWDLLNTFIYIEQEADKRLKFAEIGTKLKVSLDWNREKPAMLYTQEEWE